MEPYNPYARPVPQPPPVMLQPQGNGLAVAGMVLGIISIVLCWIWFLAGILGILAIIFGAIGIARANRVGRGKGMAITGIVTGALGIVLAIAFIFVIVALLTRRAHVAERVDNAMGQVAEVEAAQIEGWYQRWQLTAAEACPMDLREVARAVKASDHELLDPWGNEYRFVCGPDAGLPDGRTFGVYSIGEDGRPGTSDDIKSWRRR